MIVTVVDSAVSEKLVDRGMAELRVEALPSFDEVPVDVDVEMVD